MGHHVEDDINAHWVGPFFRVIVEVFLVLAFAFPTVAEVVVVAQ